MVVPSIEPKQFYAGDTVKWSRSLSDFPASGWTLAYKFANKDQSVAVASGDVTADGDTFQVEIPAEESGALNAGVYQLVGCVTDVDGNRYVVANGIVHILQNPGVDGDPYDFRTKNQRVLDSIEAMIEGRDIDDEHTMPDGRSLKRMPIKDLLFWQQVYAGRVMKEKGTLPQFVGARFQR